MTENKRPNQGKAAKDLNATVRYTMWSVFRLRDVLGEADRETEAAEVLLKRLRRGAEPHADLLEALEANRYADGAPPNPTPS